MIVTNVRDGAWRPACLVWAAFPGASHDNHVAVFSNFLSLGKNIDVCVSSGTAFISFLERVRSLRERDWEIGI